MEILEFFEDDHLMVKKIKNKKGYIFEVGNYVVFDTGIDVIESFKFIDNYWVVFTSTGDGINIDECKPGMNKKQLELLDNFHYEMKRQLHLNAYKGNFEGLLDINEIIREIEYHKSKLLLAYKEGYENGILEYCADCANYFLMFANACELLQEKRLDVEETQMISGIFQQLNTFDIKRKTFHK